MVRDRVGGLGARRLEWRRLGGQARLCLVVTMATAAIDVPRRPVAGASSCWRAIVPSFRAIRQGHHARNDDLVPLNPVPK
jgi:hypothetical protein